MAVERKLQHARPGETERITERAHVRSDESQVLRDERHTAQTLAHSVEEVGARPRHPPTGLRGRRRGRYVPRRRESSEMIEADRVDVSQQGAQAVEAPAVAVRG